MYSGPKDHNNAKGHSNKGHKAPAPAIDDMDEINSAMTGNFGMHNLMVTNFHDGPSGPTGIAVTDFNAPSPQGDGMISSTHNQGLPPLRGQDNLSDITLAPLSGFDPIDNTPIDTSNFETFDESKFNGSTTSHGHRNTAPTQDQFPSQIQSPDDFFPAINGGNSNSDLRGQSNLDQGNYSLNDLSPNRRDQHAYGQGRGQIEQVTAEQAAMSAVPSRFSAPQESVRPSTLGSFSALDPDDNGFNGNNGAQDGVFSESDYYESPEHVYESMQQNYFKQNQPRGAFKPTQDQRFANEYAAPATWAVSQSNRGFNGAARSNQNMSNNVFDSASQAHNYIDESNAFAPVAGRNVSAHGNTRHIQPMRSDATAQSDFDPFAKPFFEAPVNSNQNLYADNARLFASNRGKSEAPQYLSPGVHSDRDPENRYEHLTKDRPISIDKEEVERRSREIWGESSEQNVAQEALERETHTMIYGMDNSARAVKGINERGMETPLSSLSSEASPFVTPGVPINNAMQNDVAPESSQEIAATYIKEENPIYTAGIEGNNPREMRLLNPTAPSTIINGLSSDEHINNPSNATPISAIVQKSLLNAAQQNASAGANTNPYAKAFAALNKTNENHTKISGQSSAMNQRHDKEPEVSTMISRGTAAVASGPENFAKANYNTAISGNRAAAFSQNNNLSNKSTVLTLGNKVINDPYSKFNQAQSRASELSGKGTSFNFSFTATSGRPMSPSQAASNRSAAIGVGSSAGDAVASAFAQAGHSHIEGNGSAALNKVVSATALAKAGSDVTEASAEAISKAVSSLASEIALTENQAKSGTLFGASTKDKTVLGDHTGAAVLSGKTKVDSDKTSESVKALGSTTVDISGFVDPWLTDKTIPESNKSKDKPTFFADDDSFKPKQKTEFMEVNPLEDLAPSQPDSESIDMELPELSSDSPLESLDDIKKLHELTDLDDDDDFLGAVDHTAGNKKESKEEGIRKLNFNPLATPVSSGPEFTIRDEDILKPQTDTIAQAASKAKEAARANLKHSGPKGDLSNSTKLWGLENGAVDAFSKLTQAADKLSAQQDNGMSAEDKDLNEREFMDFAASQGDLTSSYNSEGQNNYEPLQKNPAINLNNYLLRCRSGIGQCLYLVQSGLSLDVIDGFNLGYDAYFKTENHAYGTYNPLRPAGSRSYPALIIPLSADSYVAYNIQSLPTKAGPGADDPVHHYIGKSTGFNLQVLDDTEANAIFICAGELDALSLLSLGQQALAIGTPLNAIHVLEHLQQLFSSGKLGSRSQTTFYICMPQQEKQWKDASEALQAGMSAFNLNAHPLTLHNPYKSIHQALVADRNALQDRLNKLREISEVTLQEAVHAEGVQGLVLSLQSLAKLELSAMMYTLSSPAAALSRLVMASLIENKNRSILYAGSKMQWQMLCSLLSFTPNSFDKNSHYYRARFLEMPLDLNADIMDAALNHGLQAASFNGLNNPVLMVDTFAYDNDLCAKLSPRLAQLSIEFNTSIMVWCSQEQRSIFEGNSLQTIEMTQGNENEIVFTTLDSSCRTHVFSTISGQQKTKIVLITKPSSKGIAQQCLCALQQLTRSNLGHT